MMLCDNNASLKPVGAEHRMGERRRLPGACLSLSGNQISGIPRHQRDVVPSTQVRVVRKTLFAPREGRQLLFSDGHVGDHWLPHDVHEGAFNARRSRRYACCQDGVHLFCMDIGKLRGALEHAELPWRDVVGALRH